MKTVSRNLIAIAFVGTTMLACNQNQESESEEGVPVIKEVTFINEEGELQLNTDGAKWQANPETTAGAEELKSLVANFELTDSTFSTCCI
jgi:hypothetical protein